MTDDDRENQANNWRLQEWLLVGLALVMLTLTLWSLAGDRIQTTLDEWLNPPTPTPGRPTPRPVSWGPARDVVVGIDGWEDGHH